jgi:hypothetical protein
MAELLTAVADVVADVKLKGLTGNLEPVDMDVLLANHDLGGSGKMSFSAN